MANVSQMENYFTEMSKGKIEPSELYIINQKGRGIGNPRRSKAIYRIPNQTGSGSTAPFISPIAQGIAQARSHLKQGTKRKRSGSASHSAKRRRTTKKKTKKTKKKRSTKKRTKGTKKKGSKRKKTSRSVFKDYLT